MNDPAHPARFLDRRDLLVPPPLASFPRSAPCPWTRRRRLSDSILALDRNHIGSLYAAGGIDDYWIVNLVQRQLEAYRDPLADRTQPFGFRYNSRTILDPSDTVSPLAAPQSQITVTELLP